MSKIKTILTASALALGMIGGGPVLAVTATTEDVRLQENINNEFFRTSSVDPYAGEVMLRLIVPTEQTLERIVVARPAEDRYRLIPELDTAALNILDGEAKGLELVEMENPGREVYSQKYERWVGFDFYDYTHGGLRFLERNPADVIYLGIVLKEKETGAEIRNYYKLDYRDCAHEQKVIDGKIIMCNAVHDGGKTYYLPATMDEVGPVPTWEEELLSLAKGVKQEYFDELEKLEVGKDEGREVSEEQIGELEAKEEEITANLTKFPELTRETLKADYVARVEALRKKADDKGSGDSTGDKEPEVTTPVVTKPQTPQTGNVAGNNVPGNNVPEATQEVAKVPIPVGTVSGATLGVATGATEVAKETTEIEALAVTGDEISETGVEQMGEMEEQEEMEVPKLGGSWLERYWLAIMIAGASALGVAGWFLIGVIGKKRKHNER